MKLMIKSLSAIVLSLSAATALAIPAFLTTHNNTNVESNAFVAGVPSPYPTAANSTRQVYWNMVRMACYGHTTNGKCTALIKMASNTNNPVDLGVVTMDLDTGEISPKKLSANGYSMTVTGIAEATLTKDK